MDNEKMTSQSALNLDNALKCIEFVQNSYQSLINDKELCEILGDEFSARMREWDNAITKRRNEPFSLVILGDFKRGKSTIINAILGKQLAPVNAAPETFTINTISYGEKPSVTAILKNGIKKELTRDDLIRDRLEQIMQTLPSPIDYVDVRDNAEILKEVRIVDTPGLSDMNDLDQQVQDYLINADAVIYVASALLPFSESEQMFLATHVAPQKFGKIYVLVNMIDALNSREDIDKILTRVANCCQQIVPNAVVYGISGIDEFKRKTDAPRTDLKGFQEYYETEFFKFERSLRRDIITQKDYLRVQRVLTMQEIMLEDTAARVDMISEVSALDKQKLDTLMEGFQEEGAHLSAAIEANRPKLLLSIAEMKQEAERWMYEFFSKLREDIVACRNEVTAEDVEAHFHSYLMDKVGEAYRKCIEAHQARTDALIERMSRDLAKKLGIGNLAVNAASGGNVSDYMREVNEQVAKSVKNVTGKGSGTFPSATISSFKLILRTKKRSDIIDVTLEKFDEIRNSTVKDLSVAYATLEEKALKRFDNLYETQLNMGKDAINQTKEMLDKTDNEKMSRVFEKTKTVLDNARNALNETAFV